MFKCHCGEQTWIKDKSKPSSVLAASFSIVLRRSGYGESAFVRWELLKSVAPPCALYSSACLTLDTPARIASATR